MRLVHTPVVVRMLNEVSGRTEAKSGSNQKNKKCPLPLTTSPPPRPAGLLSPNPPTTGNGQRTPSVGAAALHARVCLSLHAHAASAYAAPAVPVASLPCLA